MSSANDYKNTLLIGSIVGLVGAVALIVGMILSFNIFDISSSTFTFGIIAITLIIGISITLLFTLIGCLSIGGFSATDERLGLVALTIFLFAPTTIISEFASPFFYILGKGNDLLSGTDFGFYLAIVGTALILITFFIFVWVFLLKRGASSTGGLNLSGSSDIGLVKILRIITSLLVIIAGAAVILGMIFAPYSTTSTVSGLLLSLDGTQLDLAAIGFMVIILGIVVSAAIVMLANFGLFKNAKTEAPLLALLGIIIVLPGYAPTGISLGIWSSPVFAIMQFIDSVNKDSTQTISIWGWILFIGILTLVLGLFLGSISFFYSISGTSTGRTKRVKVSKKSKLEAKKKKGKFPTGPPSASPETSGGLAGQLSQANASSPPAATSGPPSAASAGSQPALSGPPSAGQPQVSSEPPTPPTFMPTSQPAAAQQPSSDEPTCPFCGKNLRFIEEYQRWYCDSCSQYV